MQIERTREQIDEAIRQAQKAKELQDELFMHVKGYDTASLHGTLGFTMHHVGAFIRGMMKPIGANLVSELHNGHILEVRLPEHLRGVFPEFDQRAIVRIATDRRLAQRLRNVVLLDFSAPFFKYLIEAAKAQSFDGIYASIVFPPNVRGSVAGFKLRWQNDQGDARTEEFVTLFATAGGAIERNPPFLADWLMSSVDSAPAPTHEVSRSDVFDRLQSAANRLLAQESTRFKHPNGLIKLAAADGYPQEI